MNCACHDEPAYWNRDPRYRAGGFWRCAVKKRAGMRARYDRDPIHRIEKRLRQDARMRRLRLEARKARLREES